MPHDPWPHQLRAVEETHARRAAGSRRVVVASPTGMGKTWIAERLVRDELAEGGKALLYTGRRMMLEQLQRDFSEAGVPFAVRAAGYMAEAFPFQIASLPTDRTRSKKDDYEDFPATLVLVDEGHLHAARHAQRVLGRHLARGACVVYLTATPVNMGGVADALVQAGTVSEGRACGALVRALHYGPDEPALAHHHKTLTGLLGLSENAVTAAMGRVTGGAPDRKLTCLFGRVLEWFDKLNPLRKPTILFAPGVPESRWFAEEFMRRGITAAHVDGEEVTINGATYESSKEAREEVRRGSEAGHVQVVCNRFVLREGVNYPWLAHGIFATVFDSVQSYLQAGGRLLRSHPGVGTVCVQDHGGNWWRHGSLNEDRIWSLDHSSRVLAGVREDGYREPKDKAPPEAREPFLCPACRAVVRSRTCAGCGHKFGHEERFREVAQANGTLVKVTGKMFRPHPAQLEADTAAKWKTMYFRMRNAKKPKTFNQAVIFFAHEYGYRPPRDLPYMPRDAYDWYRPLKAVAYARLVPDPDLKPGDKPGDRRGTRKRKPAKQERGLFDGVSE